VYRVTGFEHDIPVETPSKLRLDSAAHEFEAQMMKELIKPVTRIDVQDASESGGALTEFAGEALGQALSRAGGFGIAERLIARLSQFDTVDGQASKPGMRKDLAANP